MRALTPQGTVGKAQSFIIDYSMAQHDVGVTFPIWGTCLGFEGLLVHNGCAKMTKMSTSSDLLPLRFYGDVFQNSTLLKNAPSTVLSTLRSPVTINMHTKGVKMSDFTSNLKRKWNLLATSSKGGLEFVALVESVQGNMFGSQFHPEKNGYEFLQSWEKDPNARGVHRPRLYLRCSISRNDS